jgi:hypothetical protein
MVNTVHVEYGKSLKYYSTHCCVCRKVFTPTENRVKAKAEFLNGEIVPVLFCEPCAVTAEYQEAAKQLKEKKV